MDEESEKSGSGLVVMVPKIEAIENGGVAYGTSAGSSGNSLQTYKRRKYTKMSSAESKLQLLEDGNVSIDSSSQHTDKTTNDPLSMGYNDSSCNQTVVARPNSPALINDTINCPLKRCRNNVLENMYQSLPESEGGLQECIRDALEFRLENGCTTAVKESLNSSKEIHKSPSETELMPNGTESAAKTLGRVMSNGLLNESIHHTNTELCKRAFFDILTSENFSKLCKLLSENFQGVKADSIFDVTSINTRMKEGAYESSPMLFQSDIQQLWTKLQKFGTEMTVLAKSLSEKSRTSCREQFLKQESDMHAKPDQSDVCGMDRVCTCKHCGKKAQGGGEGGNYLVCDSCEELYHLSCIKPRLKEIPPRNWYCTNCTANGILLPHDDCLVCERINAPVSSITGPDEVPTSEESLLELEGSSSGLDEDGAHCTVCRNDVEAGEEFKRCGHLYCPHKYYHTKCLTNKQLSSYGPCWFCPSCLCRGCLTDKDDDKIILCEACDHAYHIYCMFPPRSTIPRGKWFCHKCQEEIRRIREVKKTYELMSNVWRMQAEEKKKAYGSVEIVEKKRGTKVLDKSGGVDVLLTAVNKEKKVEAYADVKIVEKEKGKEVLDKCGGVDMLLIAANEKRQEGYGDAEIAVRNERGKEVIDKSGGVDMLLTAAKTLNFEENLAALGMRS